MARSGATSGPTGSLPDPLDPNSAGPIRPRRGFSASRGSRGRASWPVAGAAFVGLLLLLPVASSILTTPTPGPPRADPSSGTATGSSIQGTLARSTPPSESNPRPVSQYSRIGPAVPQAPSPENAYSGAEPAPMGIGDLGGTSGGPQGSFTTTEFRGSIAVGAIDAGNSSLPDPYSVSFQLNAFLAFDTPTDRYAYWVQDVAILSSHTRAIQFEDNVWNASSVYLYSSAIGGNGSVTGSGDSSFYGDSAPCYLPGACVTLANPETVNLSVVASLGSGGVPTVRVLYGESGPMTVFDTVRFPWAKSIADFRGFDVDSGLGISGACPRCFGDVELIVGGPGNGSQTELVGSTDLVLSLDWWNGNNFEPVPNAVDHGEATEEGVSRAVVAASTGADQGPTATIANGTRGKLDSLWSPTSLTTVEVSVVTGSVGGNLSVGGALLPFSGTFVETVLVPGSTALSVHSGGSTYSLGTVLLGAGEFRTFEVGAEPLLFVPVGLPLGTVWSVTTAGELLYGTGNITFGETSGIYAYAVGDPPGYRASNGTGNATVGGSGGTVTVEFHSTYRSPWAELEGDLAPYTDYLILGAIVLGVAVGLAVALGRRKRPAT